MKKSIKFITNADCATVVPTPCQVRTDEHYLPEDWKINGLRKYLEQNNVPKRLIGISKAQNFFRRLADCELRIRGKI
jgi:hypothetical protein